MGGGQQKVLIEIQEVTIANLMDQIASLRMELSAKDATMLERDAIIARRVECGSPIVEASLRTGRGSCHRRYQRGTLFAQNTKAARGEVTTWGPASLMISPRCMSGCDER